MSSQHSSPKQALPEVCRVLGEELNMPFVWTVSVLPIKTFMWIVPIVIDISVVDFVCILKGTINIQGAPKSWNFCIVPFS